MSTTQRRMTTQSHQKWKFAYDFVSFDARLIDPGENQRSPPSLKLRIPRLRYYIFFCTSRKYSNERPKPAKSSKIREIFHYPKFPSMYCNAGNRSSCVNTSQRLTTLTESRQATFNIAVLAFNVAPWGETISPPQEGLTSYNVKTWIFGSILNAQDVSETAPRDPRARIFDMWNA